MKAIIMAGGEGTRLRPITCDKPKPMINIMGMPIMEYVINLLKSHGIIEIGVTLHYLPNEISDYFKDGEKFGVELSYFVEDMPLGTAGSVKNAEKFLDENVVVISGDALTSINLTDAIEFHNSKKALATLVLSEVENPTFYGVVTIDETKKVTRFLEKPEWSEVFNKNANTGIYILNPEILSFCPKNEFFDFSKDLFPKIISQNKEIYGFVSNDYWCDIGDVETYRKCHFDIFEGKFKINLKEYKNTECESKDIYLGENVSIDKNALIKDKVFIESGTKIFGNAEVGPYTVIGKNCVIKPGSSVKRSIIWDNCIIENKAQVRGSIFCLKVKAKENSKIFEGSVIGMKSIVGEETIIEPNIRIWPFKTIEDDLKISQNLVWGNTKIKKIFSGDAASGEINIDITPEFLVKIASSFSSIIQTGKLGIGYDCGNGNEMIKNAIISGILASGLSVYEFGEQPLPITRSAVRFYELSGAIHIQLSSSDLKNESSGSVEIKFLSPDGTDISREIERKLETVFLKEDFIRSESVDIKTVVRVENYKYYYIDSVIKKITDENMTKNFEILCSSKTVIDLLQTIVNEIKDDEEKPVLEEKFISEISSSGENLTVYSSETEKLTFDQYMMLAAVIVLMDYPDTTFVLPVNAPKNLEDLVENFGGTVSYSKMSNRDFLKKIMEDGTELQFKLFSDGLYSAFYILSFLIKNNLTVGKILKHIPNFYKKEIEINCNNKDKGNVINEIMRHYKDKKLNLTHGIKVYEDSGWVLIIPDNYKNICRIIIDGFEKEKTEEMADIFTKLISRIANV
ncbi:MAG: NTP transferase domain-containing protein [Clostridiales bacterium]|nr:NTP transferase domain-containing protein [Clostridiales bacterium]